MKGTIKVLDGSGHTEIPYDTDRENGELEAVLALNSAHAERCALFDGETRDQIDGGTSAGTILREHEQVLVIPPMAGGR